MRLALEEINPDLNHEQNARYAAVGLQNDQGPEFWGNLNQTMLYTLALVLIIAWLLGLRTGIGLPA